MVGVYLKPGFGRAAGDTQLLPGLLHHHGLGRAVAGGDAHRHPPDLGIRSGCIPVVPRAVVNKTFLFQGQFHRISRSRGGNPQDRISHLLDPGVHYGCNRLSRNLFQRRPEVFGPGIAVLVGRQVPPEALPEHVGSQELLQHADNRGAFAIADGVKKLADLSRVFHFLLNWVGVFQTVQAQGPVGVHVHKLGPHGPFREKPVHGLGAHPRRKTFVEPQIVPPLHGHQVAEPHVGHLVGHHLGDSLPSSRRGVYRVYQQSGFPVGYGPPVFHRAGGKVRDGDVVQFLQRVWDVEVFVEKRQKLDRGIQGKVPLLFVAPGSPDTHRGLGAGTGVIRLCGYQVPNHKCQEVG